MFYFIEFFLHWADLRNLRLFYSSLGFKFRFVYESFLVSDYWFHSNLKLVNYCLELRVGRLINISDSRDILDDDGLDLCDFNP